MRAREGDAWLAIVKADPGDPVRSLRHFYEIEALPPGWGWCLTTYAGDGDPLPPFRGDPVALPLAGDLDSLTAAFWELLDGENRVALALKAIDAGTGKESLRIVNARERAD
ncbi:MAG: hypothetical protein GWO16_11550 [Gammaproteobacteria bacterium]|nr:hypothetical protein [Gammaproteobacteria bacterium]NIR98569.1 hypothetical protein [Gammaproteobacteria bacterium]NIT64287.1 hypothetical protein [Gammaproteobacteria bacterium]NIV21217.1 hypothetical protein [Gammaproteobacteria bacterium]NIY32867.1 hypothetical protein [Gammaproteobacteria bacterium]